MAAGVVGIDAVSMALMAATALVWQGTKTGQRADMAVMVAQLLSLAGEISL